MKYKALLVILFVICFNNFSIHALETSKNEVPMYGGGSFTAEEKANNKSFVNGIVGFFGSKQVACDEMIVAGWIKFFKGRFDAAMRRFNQAWLIDSENPYILLGFNQTLMFERKPQQAIKFLQKAADAGLPIAQNLLGSFYERGIEINGKVIVPKDLVKAEIWYEKADKQGYSGIWKNLRHSGKADQLKVGGGICGTYVPAALVNKINNRDYRKFTLDNPNVEEGNLIITDSIKYFVDEVKKLPANRLKNGLWLILKHSNFYAEEDKKDLQQLGTLLKTNNIHFFTCKSEDLPDGWKSIAE